MKQSAHRHETRAEREARARHLHTAAPVPVGTRKRPSAPFLASTCKGLHHLPAEDHRVRGRDGHYGRLRLLASSNTLSASLAKGGACYIFRPARRNEGESAGESTIGVARGCQERQTHQENDQQGKTQGGHGEGAAREGGGGERHALRQRAGTTLLGSREVGHLATPIGCEPEGRRYERERHDPACQSRVGEVGVVCLPRGRG